MIHENYELCSALWFRVKMVVSGKVCMIQVILWRHIPEMCDPEVKRNGTMTKRAKMTENLPVLLIVYGFGSNEASFWVSDHPVLDGIEGYFDANKRIGFFFSDEMYRTLVAEIGDDIRDIGIDESDYAKQALLYELFRGVAHGGRKPRRGEKFKSTIVLHLEPARFRLMN